MDLLLHLQPRFRAAVPAQTGLEACTLYSLPIYLLSKPWLHGFLFISFSYQICFTNMPRKWTRNCMVTTKLCFPDQFLGNPSATAIFIHDVWIGLRLIVQEIYYPVYGASGPILLRCWVVLFSFAISMPKSRSICFSFIGWWFWTDFSSLSYCIHQWYLHFPFMPVLRTFLPCSDISRTSIVERRIQQEYTRILLHCEWSIPNEWMRVFDSLGNICLCITYFPFEILELSIDVGRNIDLV